MTDSMGKEERRLAILRIYAESGLALPPKVAHTNLARAGATFSKRTVQRLLREMMEEALVRRIDEAAGYYEITDEGRSYLEEAAGAGSS